MKYTQNLIKGNYFEYQQYKPVNKLIKVPYVAFMSFGSVCFLGLCFSMLPITITFDVIRKVYCIEIKIRRRIRNFDYEKFNEKINLNFNNWMKGKAQLFN